MEKKLQFCCACDQPTGRCEEDSIYLPSINPEASDIGPLCEDCFDERFNLTATNTPTPPTEEA